MNIETSNAATLLIALLVFFAGYYLKSNVAFLKNNNILEKAFGAFFYWSYHRINYTVRVKVPIC
ncbi:MAG: Na+/glutamate symporter [Kangiellaceae bacterium]|jgi:Na+/glutamate symporter